MIQVTNLTKVYKSKNKNMCIALDNISFTLPSKGLVFIIGKSGSGKSTLLNMIGGLDSVTDGKINVFGNDIHKYNENKLYSYRSNMVGFIFQDFHLLDDLTVEENIALSLKLEKEEIGDKINKVLKEVDLDGYNNRYPYELSGGQKQRVAIARALVKNPEVILADEPTGNLDSNTTKQIIEIIKRISKNKLVIIVSHNLYDAYDYADRIIELSDGHILNDLEVNEDYSNSIKIEDNKLILPLLKRFEKSELETILKECKKDEIVEIIQDNTKFIKTKEKVLESKSINLVSKNLSIKETLSFSFIFGRKRLIRFFFSSLILAMLLVVLSLGQSIAYFNPSEIIANEILSSKVDSNIVKNIDTSMETNKQRAITEDDFKKFDEIENIDVYKLYNETLKISASGGSCRLNSPKVNRELLYVTETFGTLETTREYAKKLLGVEELEIYTGDIEYHPTGVYITDFVADSFIYSDLHGDTYDDILGTVYESKIYEWGYVNGIIKTNYQEKYIDIIEKMKTIYTNNELSEDIIEFMDYIAQCLAISYTFEEDYIGTIDINDSVKNLRHNYKLFINGIDVSNQITYVAPGSFRNHEINKGEIYMNYQIYNKIFETEYTPQTISTFEPHIFTFSATDFYEDIKFEKTLTIAKIGSYSSPYILMDEETFNEYKKELIVCTGLYLDGENIQEAIDVAINNDYIANSMRISAVQTMTKAVSVFNGFFSLIVGMLIAACIVVIISFGLKNVRSNMYEIGVLKALGCKFSRFAIMFTLHTLVISVLLFGFSLLGLYVVSDLANTILTESLKQLAPNYIILNLNFIKFDFDLILRDNLLISGIAFISTLVPIIFLKQIKPITIIKAKE